MGNRGVRFYRSANRINGAQTMRFACGINNKQIRPQTFEQDRSVIASATQNYLA
jgi:hypothetical protein